MVETKAWRFFAYGTPITGINRDTLYLNTSLSITAFGSAFAET